MRVKYVGPIDEVSVPLPSGRDLEVKRLAEVELRDVGGLSASEADALARGLVKGGEWEAVEDTKGGGDAGKGGEQS